MERFLRLFQNLFRSATGFLSQNVLLSLMPDDEEEWEQVAAPVRVDIEQEQLR